MTLPIDTLFELALKHIDNPNQHGLIKDAKILLHTITNHQISDYSFLLAPMAKAYEGFLKDFFLKVDIIDEYQYQSDRFRVGKTLNPSLRYKRFSIFQRLIDIDEKGEELAELLWDAWKYGRNEVFHYFPNSFKAIDYQEAVRRIQIVLTAINHAARFLRENQNQIEKY